MKKNIFELLDFSNIDLARVRSAYNNGDLELAKEEFVFYFRKKDFHGFIGNDKKELRNLMLRNYIQEFKEISNTAYNFSKGIIKFDMKWDMERCHREYVFNGEIEWDKIPYKDPEWTYMLNRHKHFIVYGQEYYIKSLSKYLDQFKKEIIDWIDNVPLTKESERLTWRTIECGLRLRNWVKALEYFKQDLDFETIEKIVISMNEQIEYINSKSRNDRFLSNWVILENHGVFIASAFLSGLKLSKQRIEKSLDYMVKALDMQILDDGMHWEQSYMYHNEMINCILSVVLIGKRNNIEIPESIEKKVLKMLYGTLSIMQPNYMQTNFGDSDIEDVRDILAFGAIVFNDGKLKSMINEIPIDVVFDIGLKGFYKFENIQSEKVDFISVALKDCGNYILRNKWGEDGIFTLFKCGALGSGHGHFDMLHFNINYKGHDILVDSGRYNYADDNEYRVLLKEAKSHNTFILDDKEFNTARCSWGSLKVSEAIKREHKFGKLASFVEGGHLGYIHDGAFVNRKIVFLNKGLWIVSDEIRSNGKHKYSSFFNFNSMDITKEGNDIKYREHMFKKSFAQCEISSTGIPIIPMDEFTIKIMDGQDISIEAAYISAHYNSIKRAKKAVMTKTVFGDAVFNYVMHMNDEDKVKSIEYIPIIDWRGQVLDCEYSKAIKIEYEKEIYIVVLVFKEEPRGRKTYTVDGTQIYGRVTVIRKTCDDIEIEVLNY